MASENAQDKRIKPRGGITREQVVLGWVPVSERPPEVTEGQCTILLFQHWERVFDTGERFLVQHVRPLYANADYHDNNRGCTAWLQLPPFPPMEKAPTEAGAV